MRLILHTYTRDVMQIKLFQNRNNSFAVAAYLLIEKEHYLIHTNFEEYG